MSARLNESQLEEFDKIADGDSEVIATWMEQYPDYENDCRLSQNR